MATNKQESLLGSIEPYQSSKDEEYMSEAMRGHFVRILEQWKRNLMEEVDRTVSHMKEEAANFADPADRALEQRRGGDQVDAQLLPRPRQAAAAQAAGRGRRRSRGGAGEAAQALRRARVRARCAQAARRGTACTRAESGVSTDPRVSVYGIK